MNKKCECTNCTCKKCGSQNPERLEGKSAMEAGVTDIRATWWCDPECTCCNF